MSAQSFCQEMSVGTKEVPRASGVVLLRTLYHLRPVEMPITSQDLPCHGG